jgi:hypothetical protein
MGNIARPDFLGQGLSSLMGSCREDGSPNLSTFCMEAIHSGVWWDS